MRGPRLGGPLGFYGSSDGKFLVPCPIAVLAADNLEPRVAIAFPGGPEFSGRDRLGQVEKFRATAKTQQDAHLSGLRFLCHFEGKPTVSRMRSHDGDENDSVRGEVSLVQRERRRRRPGWIWSRGLLLDETADAVRALAGRELFREPCGRFRTVVSVANKRPEWRNVENSSCRYDPLS